MNGDRFWAAGKLMLFGEYVVLRGSKCLAIPLDFGQELRVTNHHAQNVLWQSFEADELWFEAELSPNLEILRSNTASLARSSQDLLRKIAERNAQILRPGTNLKFTLSFHREWGFGTSSTLISLLSQWSGLNPYSLLKETFGGSGYDIACATAGKPIVYSLPSIEKENGGFTQFFEKEKEMRPNIEPVDLPRVVTDKLLFIYTGKKQKSSREVSKFSEKEVSAKVLEEMNQIVAKAARVDNIEDWEALMNRSEELMAAVLQTNPVKKAFYADYPFAIKSLGAWGGDFIMASYRDLEEAKRYFKEKGLKVMFDYQHIIKSNE